ncbi:peptidase family C50-domain-containing protein [Aspergillus unguis]
MAVTTFPSESPVESVKQTVRSTSTCTPATVLSLQTLFRGTGEIETATVKKAGRTTKATVTTTTASSRAKTARTRTTTKTKQPVQDAFTNTNLADARLSAQEKIVLATEVFNTTLKTLSDAVKLSTSRENSQTSPTKRTKGRSRTAHLEERTTTETDNGASAVAECARLSLSCLRMLKIENGAQGDGMPNMQLEQGACVLAGRLLALGLNDLAYKELRGLKRRIQQYLDGLSTGRKTGKDCRDGEVEEAAKERMSDLLSFSNISKARPVHGLLVSFQSSALRLIAAEKRPATVQKLLPSLQIADESSPANVIMAAMESGALTKDKTALQLQLLSTTILSLSTQSAGTVKERLKPITVLTIQLLSLETRCMSWKISGHVCEGNKEMWDPLARYMGSFAQATKSIEKAEFASIYKTIVRLQSAFAKSQSRTPKTKDNMSVARIATVLGQLAQDAGCYDEALKIFSEILTPLSNGQCLGLATVRCKIGTLHFQAIKAKVQLSANVSDAVSEATNSLGLPLKGTAHDLDELLIEAAKLKKQAMAWYGDRVQKQQSACDNDVYPRICEYLTAFVRFLRRYIGRRPADDELDDQEAFQKRIGAAQNIVSAAVDSTVAIGKLSVMSQTPPWDEMVSAFLDCQRLLTTIGPEGSDENADFVGLGLVKLSNLFWSRYLKEKEAGKGPRELLPLLKQSANLLSECSVSQRSTGFAALKFERLAHTYIEANVISEAEVAFCQSISEHITAGALEKATACVDGLFPHQISQDPTMTRFTLGRVLTAYLKVKLRNKRSAVDEIFDDDSLPPTQRGHILEWQLGILTEIYGAANTDVFRSIFAEITKRLFSIYSAAPHPLRRLRVALCGLRFALEQPGCLDSSLVDLLTDEGIDGLEGDNCEEDGDIASLAAHLKNSVRLTLGLHQGRLDPARLNIIISTWSTILRNCRDVKSLEASVGSVDYCLLQMKAVVDYTEIHGLWKFQLSTLELVLRVTELQGTATFSEAIIVLSRLVLQYCRLGTCSKAHSLLNRAEEYIKRHEVSCLARLSYDLAHVGFLLETGDIQKAETVLSAARMLYEKEQSVEDVNGSGLTKISWERVVADAAFMSSRLSFAQGSIKDALYFAKLSVRLNSRIWAKVEKLAQKKQERTIAGDSSELEIVVEGMAKLEVGRSSTYSQGAPFWPHIGSHHSSLLHLANLSAHHGLFQDAIYYGEQALKINKSLNAHVRLIASQAQLGSHWILGGHISEGQELLGSAKELAKQLESSIELVSLRLSLAAFHRVEGDYRNEYRTLREAEKLVIGLIGTETAKDSSAELEEKMENLRIRPKSRSTRQTAATATRRTRSTTTSSARSTPRPPPSADTTPLESNTLLQVKSEILRQQALSLRSQGDFQKALALLDDARKCAVTRDSKISVHLGESEHLVAEAIRSFASHAVYCVLPESTISLPSLQPGRAISEASSTKSTTRKAKAPARGTRSKAQPSTEEFSVMLSKASECLTEIFPTAAHLGSTLDSHSASRLMSRVSMLSHATASQSQAPLQSPATMNEIGRIGAFARERAAISIDKQLADYCDPLLWPRSELAEPDSISSEFTEEYVDILPESWNVLSLSLSADQTEFIVSRLHQGRSPFLLRLPLQRGNSDEDEEQFTFEDGRDEMKELIRLANESAHAAKLQVDRQAKKEWWKNREALDRRMENLLQNIENVWFGGFRGIFSPIPHDEKSLERFASSLENILDKHLPSRQKGGRAEGPRLTLHSNVLELFVGVKDLDEQEDPEDTLMDLLYFVVDILQFQGERNAYDEVDFDMMVVETLDAVRAYHENAQEEVRKQPNNTVLVLDKSLHLFPWESLPCLQGLPVCRVPSLECVRDRVLQFRAQKTNFGINRRNGTYILNPTGDLQTTQGTFEKDLSNMKNWTGIVNRQPSEEEFKESLESKSLFLYFGHGSGAQYIRGRTIKRLDQCAVAFLMGCSSGTLTEAGEYEPYGTPMNYLQAGSPALVATLWDVTDKDIDRFAKATFEHWGLLGDKACGEGIGDAVSLDAAVSQSRGACVLKYLNGAAPVVYGVPGVFLE